jgi:hypothetical protein
MLQLYQVGDKKNVREFGPVEPTIFVPGRVLLAVLVSCAGSIEV